MNPDQGAVFWVHIVCNIGYLTHERAKKKKGQQQLMRTFCFLVQIPSALVLGPSMSGLVTDIQVKVEICCSG